MTDAVRRIYHITSRPAWDTAQQTGHYEAESLHTQGFIHLSKINQILSVANAIYTSQQDLIILEVDPSRVTSDLRYEAPDMAVPAAHKTGDTFPHIYGTLNLDAVTHVHDFPPQSDGTFQLPDSIAAE
jgi:uncharacterized protein (DUF952 family)